MVGLTGSWVFYPSFYYQQDALDEETVAASRIQAVVRQRQVFAKRTAAAVTLQRAVRTRVGARCWQQPLTTLILERISPTKMRWREGQEPVRSFRTRKSASTKLATKLAVAVASFALVVACLELALHTTTLLDAAEPAKRAAEAPKAPPLEGPFTRAAVGLLGKAATGDSDTEDQEGAVTCMTLFSLGSGLIGNGSALKEPSADAPWLAPPKSPSALAGAALAAAVADKAASILLVPAVDKVSDATKTMVRVTATALEHVQLILKALLMRAKQWGQRVRVALRA
jgi:hypothetical protein